MSPAWATAQGGIPPRPPSPPLTGLVFWVKGDEGLESSAGLATAWLDQSSKGQDLDHFDVDHQPLTGEDEIDGIPCLSFPLNNVDGTTYLQRETAMVNRLDAPFGFGQARTVMAALLPKFSGAAFSITGGPVFSFFEGPLFQCLFDLEDTDDPDAFYAWSSGWRDLGAALRAPDEAGGSGGIYNGTPTLAEWRSTGYPDIAFAVNGADLTLTPGTQYGTTGPNPPGGFLIGNAAVNGFGLNFLGAVAEVLIWDYDLSSDPAARAQALAYFAYRYPSIPMV